MPVCKPRKVATCSQNSQRPSVGSFSSPSCMLVASTAWLFTITFIALCDIVCKKKEGLTLSHLNSPFTRLFSLHVQKMCGYETTCIHTHNVFQLLFFCGVSSFLGNGCEQQGVLHEPLHRHCQKVFQLETMALWSCLTPLWPVKRESKGKRENGRGGK